VDLEVGAKKHRKGGVGEKSESEEKGSCGGRRKKALW